MTITWRQILTPSRLYTFNCYVGQEGEGAEYKVSLLSKPRLDDLEEGLGSRSSHLQHDGEDGEDDDLYGGAPRVPVGAADAVLQH